MGGIHTLFGPIIRPLSVTLFPFPIVFHLHPFWTWVSFRALLLSFSKASFLNIAYQAPNVYQRCSFGMVLTQKGKNREAKLSGCGGKFGWRTCVNLHMLKNSNLGLSDHFLNYSTLWCIIKILMLSHEKSRKWPGQAIIKKLDSRG